MVSCRRTGSGTMLGSYLFNMVGSSFSEPPQCKEHYVTHLDTAYVTFHELFC